MRREEDIHNTSLRVYVAKPYSMIDVLVAAGVIGIEVTTARRMLPQRKVVLIN